MRIAAVRVRPRGTPLSPRVCQLSTTEIDVLIQKLVRGHLSTFQEEYADLKQALAHG